MRLVSQLPSGQPQENILQSPIAKGALLMAEIGSNRRAQIVARVHERGESRVRDLLAWGTLGPGEPAAIAADVGLPVDDVPPRGLRLAALEPGGEQGARSACAREELRPRNDLPQ